MLSLSGAVRRRRISSVFSKLVLLVLVALGLGFFAFLWLLPDEEVVLDRNADGIVVLTGGTSRVADALELLAAGRGKRLLISGVNPGTTTADIARQTAGYDKLLRCCVDLDYSAINTLGNAVETRRWAIERGFHSLVIVTSAYHMPRAIGVFRRAGFPVEAYPVDWRTRGPIDLWLPFESVTAGLRRTDTAVHEWIGLFAYWLTGRTSELFPAP